MLLFLLLSLAAEPTPNTGLLYKSGAGEEQGHFTALEKDQQMSPE